METERLMLSPYSPRQLLAMVDEPERFEELTGFPAADGLRSFLVSDEVSPSYIARLRGSGAPDPWIHGFAIIHRERRCVIGSAAFKGHADPTGTVEIAYGIVPAFQGQGYATEAAAALVAFASGSDDVRVIRAHTLPEPNASTRVLSKCGFQYTGEVVDPEDGLVWRWERLPLAPDAQSSFA